MSIRPVDHNAAIQRTQDFGNIKQNQDNRPVVEQHVLQTGQVKHEQELAQKVIKAEEKKYEQYRYDAKERGNGKYESNQDGKKKKDKKEQMDGKVTVKGQTSGFDIKI